MMDSRRVDTQSLPEDAAALRALVLATIAERDAAVTKPDILTIVFWILLVGGFGIAITVWGK